MATNLSNLTTNQQSWQSQYEALKVQQNAYKTQITSLTNLNDLTNTQLADLKFSQKQLVAVENQLQTLKGSIDTELTGRLKATDAAIGQMIASNQTSLPNYQGLLDYKNTVLQAQGEVDVLKQGWVIPDPGSTSFDIDGYRYINNGSKPEAIGIKTNLLDFLYDTATSTVQSVRSFVYGGINGMQVAVTDATSWLSHLDPKFTYDLCKRNYDVASKVTESLIPTLKIPEGLTGLIIDKTVGQAHDYAWNQAANACEIILPKESLYDSFFSATGGNIPADIATAFNSFESQILLTFDENTTRQLVGDLAFENSVKKSLAASQNMPLDMVYADASQASGKAMTDFGNAPEATWNSTVSDSAEAQSTLEQSISDPTGLQTLTSALATTIDVLSFIKAIRSGEPLPVVTSGLKLANTLTGNSSYSLSGAADVGSGILSLMSLDAALKRGDTLGAITAGAQTLSYGAQAYAKFALANPGVFPKSEIVSSINSAFNTPLIDGIPGSTALPMLNLVTSIANGDEVGAAMAAISMTPAAPIAYAYYAFEMITSLFSDNTPPEAWGTAAAHWVGNDAVTRATGAYGGLESATATYDTMLAYLDQLVAEAKTLNPGSELGIVANRLPSLSYRNYTGYSITDTDPLTGVQNAPGTLYDLNGRPYNAPPGSEQASQSLTERMVRVALGRGAIAPMWEVKTAALQTKAGDPMAGLTEEERAGRAGKLAPALTASDPSTGSGQANTQIFRPVALDLNGDGVKTTGTNKTVAINVDGTGYIKSTAWLNNNDGFLFLDRNLNGQMDGGGELFNNGVVALSERGLKGLRWLDSNYDGKLTALDPVWKELQVWQDANGDGVGYTDTNNNGKFDATEPNEYKTLAQLGITELNYSMGTFTRNGQVRELSSPNLTADAQGTITYSVPEGIVAVAWLGEAANDEEFVARRAA